MDIQHDYTYDNVYIIAIMHNLVHS